MKRSFNASVMRKANRSLILDLIRQEGPISRNQIARQLKMSVPTVLRIVEGLKAEDLVHEVPDRVVSRGHPQSLIELNSNGYAILGVDLGGTKLYGAVTDLAGRALKEVFIPNRANSPEENLDQLCSVIEDLLKAPLAPGQKIRGIGIGVPAITRYPQGEVVWAPSLQWRDLPLKAILAERFEYPVFVENDVNLAALGELWFGAGQRARNIVCISLGTGIGAGIILNGALYRGHHFSAGEIGYLVPGRQFLGRSYDQFGALEYLASGGGIASRAREAPAELAALAAKNGSPDPEELTAEAVFAAARQGEPWAVALVDEMVDYLTISITAVIGLMDPEVIVLNGGVSRSADLLVEPILKRLEGLVPVMPRIELSPLGSQAPVLGAVMMVMDATTKRLTGEWS